MIFVRTALNTNTKTLGGRISFARARAGLSAAQLARRLGVKTRTLTRWEREETVPRTNRLVMLAQFLDVDPRWLLEGEATYAPRERRPRVAQIEKRLEDTRDTIADLSNQAKDLERLLEDAREDERRRRDVA